MRVLFTRHRAPIDALIARKRRHDPAVLRSAERIVADVRRRGDAAVRAWARRLDAHTGRVEVSRAELARGWTATPRDVRRAIQLAIRHVSAVAEQQGPRTFTVKVRPGVTIEQRVEPLARVGCYVPGGRHPLPSTVVMTVVPARVAGVREILVACPRPAGAVLCAALEAGATRVLRVGGPQAIGAFAYGTRSIPPVDKIVGPGNAWVAAAKTLVSRDCAIDFQAGPSEIVICSDTGRPDWIAADLIAQAEHDPDARAILVTTRATLARSVQAEVARQLPAAAGPAAASFRRNGAVIVARNWREAVDVVNRLAPEHVVCDSRRDAGQFRTAGTIFVGAWSAQAAGDYATGSNHVLPTGGAGRFRGGLSTADFTRVFTVQTLTRSGLLAIAPAVISLAEAEGLSAHAASIRVRLPSVGVGPHASGED